MTTSSDTIQRFIFEHHPVRGLWVRLDNSVQALIKNHEYPAVVQRQLFEAAVATCLLTETVKFEGKLSLQAQSGGPLSLLLIQATHNHTFRGIARFTDPVPETDDLKQLMPGAQMALTIEPNEGKRYQGIVPMHQHTLAHNLEDYFKQSEQLDTRIWLFSSENTAFGLMLQALPDSANNEGIDHLSQLANTLTAEEALSLEPHDVLHRLYHQDQVRLFDEKNIEFKCGCSREKSLASLVLVPREELEELLAEEGKVNMNCEFCRAHYQFDSIDVEQIFANDGISRQHDTPQ